MNAWAVFLLITLYAFVLYVLEVRLGSHAGIYLPELGFDAEEDKRTKLPAREFFRSFLPLMLVTVLVTAVPELLSFLAQIF